MNCSPPDSSVHGDSTGKNTGVGCHALLGIFPTQGLNPGLPHWRWIFLSFEPPGKPKNTGVGSLSLLQGNFLTQELNWGLLNCRWILYQLSYLRSMQGFSFLQMLSKSCYLIFWIIPILTDTKRYLTMVLICISLITSNIEHIFVYPFGYLCVFSAKISIEVICPFYNQVINSWIAIELYEFLIYFRY